MLHQRGSASRICRTLAHQVPHFLSSLVRMCLLVQHASQMFDLPCRSWQAASAASTRAPVGTCWPEAARVIADPLGVVSRTPSAVAQTSLKSSSTCGRTSPVGGAHVACSSQAATGVEGAKNITRTSSGAGLNMVGCELTTSAFASKVPTGYTKPTHAFWGTPNNKAVHSDHRQ